MVSKISNENSETLALLKAKVRNMKTVVKTGEGERPGDVANLVKSKVKDNDVQNKPKEDEKMAGLEDSLTPLQSVDGYLASAIFDMGGEVLAQHNNSKYDVSLIGANAVSLINAALKAVSAAGLGKCNFVQVNSDKGIFGAVWAVEDQSVAAVLLEPNANVGMAKLQLAKVGEVSGSHLA